MLSEPTQEPASYPPPNPTQPPIVGPASPALRSPVVIESDRDEDGNTNHRVIATERDGE